MASLAEPFDANKPGNFIKVTRRSHPDLPPHVLGSRISWRYPPGYYLYQEFLSNYQPVEFLDNHWHCLIADEETYYTALEDRIHPYQEGTGYWRLSDPQHPKHTVPQILPTPGPSTATVDISASGDPPRTPLKSFPSPIFASNPDASNSDSEETSDTSSAETQVDPAQVELPLLRIATPQEQLEENILVTQLENILALKERELENPLTPDQPAYLQLIEEAVTVGVNVLPPPPAIQQPAPVVPQVVPLPMDHQAQQQALTTSAATHSCPSYTANRTTERRDYQSVFNGDRHKSETFIQQFNVHWGLNNNHEIMQVPYLRTMYALSLIKGPLVKDWANDQVVELRNKVSRANNPILRDDNTLWNEFNAAFIAAFSDTARVQNAHMSLQHLKMRGDDLDTYISTFRHLAKEANYVTSLTQQQSTSLPEV